MAGSINANCNFSDATCSDYAEIVVVRHGETAWNADGRIQGHLDVELNDVGRQQAAAVADRLSKEMGILAVYSSDLKRAFGTANIIANRCGVPEVITDPDLRERHLGDLQGLQLKEAAELKPDAYVASSSSRTDQEIPVRNCGGGESFEQLYQRCMSALQKIGMKHKGNSLLMLPLYLSLVATSIAGEQVVVVTHGGVLRAFHKRSAPAEKLPGKIPNASVNKFHLIGEEWILKTWGDINHLSETGYLETAFGGEKTSG